MTEITDIVNVLKDEGNDDKRIDKWVKKYVASIKETEKKKSEEKKKDEEKKPHKEPLPRGDDKNDKKDDDEGGGGGGGGDDEDEDDDKETQSKPPVPPEPKPEDPSQTKYEPEGNVDGGGGGAAKDPPCKPIFDPKIPRMKRGKVLDKVVTGGPDGYRFEITSSHLPLKNIPLQVEPKGTHKADFTGQMVLTVNSMIPTRIFVPTPEMYLTKYSADDGTKLDFKTDGNDNLWVQAAPGTPEHLIMLDFTMMCEMSAVIGNLLYYYAEISPKATLSDSYNAGLKIGFNFNESIADEIRLRVPELLKLIDAKYFNRMIEVLEEMGIPGIPLTKEAEAKFASMQKSYNLKDIVEILAGYTSSFGCGDMPSGDMMIESTRARQGSCRNRTIPFFVICNTIGIPCRYVCSDCHAYPEIYIPNTSRWYGLDLNGCPPGGGKKKKKKGGGGGGGGKPPEPPNQVDEFKKELIHAGWKENEPKFAIAMQAFQEHIRKSSTFASESKTIRYTSQKECDC